VREKSHGVKRYRHPLVGDLELHYETLTLPADDRQTLVVSPGSASETTLRVLALHDTVALATPKPAGPGSTSPTAFRSPRTRLGPA